MLQATQVAAVAKDDATDTVELTANPARCHRHRCRCSPELTTPVKPSGRCEGDRNRAYRRALTPEMARRRRGHRPGVVYR
ncbi:hypothetical protein OIU92_00135 [Escherichia coli]|nr:hypothetical protein [Escherichia coli]